MKSCTSPYGPMLPRCSEVVSFAEMGATPTVVAEPRCTCAQCGTFQEPQGRRSRACANSAYA